MYNLFSRLLISFLVSPILVLIAIYATADSGAEFSKHIQDLYADSLGNLLSLVYAYIKVSMILFMVLVVELLVEVIELASIRKAFKKSTVSDALLGRPEQKAE